MAARSVRILVALCAAAVIATAVPGPAGGAPFPASAAGNPFLDGAGQGLDSVDARPGSVAPTAAARARVDALGANVTWNRFGTPSSLIRYGSYLATGLGSDPVAAARSFVTANKALFRLSDAGLSRLELLNDQVMSGGKGHAVLFRQRFGDLAAAHDGMITVGVVDGKVAYVSSSAVGDGTTPAAPVLSAEQAWARAAANVGRVTPLAAISAGRVVRGWTEFDVRGAADVQRTRLVALPTPRNGVRTAYEALVVDSTPGSEMAWSVFVDAVDGAVLLRTSRLDHAEPETGQFSGSFTPPSTCGAIHPIDVPVGTRSITAVVNADVPTNDIVVQIVDPGSSVVAEGDVLTSPEVVTYSPQGGIPAGIYGARVCPFDDPVVPFAAPFTYQGLFLVSEAPGPQYPIPPVWKYFLANPEQDGADTDTRVVGCFTRADADQLPPDSTAMPPICDREEGNTAARAPWDVDARTGIPTFTTSGNAARSTQGWLNPVGPADLYSPVSLNRSYVYPWTDEWRNTKCDLASLGSPQRNDIDAATTNLFVEHNRMHDFSYFLGFTENNYNLQVTNFGNTTPDRENDPELGQAQAGAITGGFPLFLGRNNANQATLPDGVPGITNMYLWQPLPAAWYSDCVDGDYDQSVIAHEYTHAISNRMVGGPDSNLTSDLDGQARAMGESYSDVTAIEYLNAFDYVPVGSENPFSVGSYVTGNLVAGIRNYGMNNSPLNYGNLRGWDGSGEGGPHEDGEIWSAVNFDIRKAMIARYNGAFPATNAALQRRCAEGRLPADQCPGNRRWMQIVFDAYLLMPPSVTMLGSRDAYLAADLMTFGGANQALLWDAFARRGMGQFSSTTDTNDRQPVPNYESPLASNEATVTFAPVDEKGTPIPDARIYVGRFESRNSPIADTVPGAVTPPTNMAPTARFLPGTYEFVIQAPGYGLQRFFRKFSPGITKTTKVFMSTNWASTHKGATATGDGGNLRNLIDDTEASNYVSGPTNPASNPGPTPTQTASGRQVTVDLAGGAQLVDSVKVSAVLRHNVPCAAPDQCDPADLQQSRFSALRQFAVEVCTASVANEQCAARSTVTTPGPGWQRIFTSAADAFPSGQPRPVTPNLVFKAFDVPDRTATHVRMVVLHNQCTGNTRYHGDQDNDPFVNSDCRTDGSPDEASPQLLGPQDRIVRAAEFQVFSRGGEGTGGSGTPKDPFVAFLATGDPTADQGQLVTYEMRYRNLGPAPSSAARIIDVLPAGVSFVSATGPASYDARSRTVRWNLGDVPVDGSGKVTLTVRVGAGVPSGTVITNEPSFGGALTTATPAVVATLVL